MLAKKLIQFLNQIQIAYPENNVKGRKAKKIDIGQLRDMLEWRERKNKH